MTNLTSILCVAQSLKILPEKTCINQLPKRHLQWFTEKTCASINELNDILQWFRLERKYASSSTYYALGCIFGVFGGHSRGAL